MELLIVTLVLSALAVMGQLRDAVGNTPDVSAA
jgi:hypothetical protein